MQAVKEFLHLFAPHSVQSSIKSECAKFLQIHLEMEWVDLWDSSCSLKCYGRAWRKSNCSVL